MLCVSAAGCALHPTEHTREDVPGAFDQRREGASTLWPGEDWYRGFSSKQLDRLLTIATGNNLDLAAARARIAQADARARIAGAAILPSVDFQGNAAYLAGHSSSSGSGHETDWSALFSMSYEIDLWGKNRATADSAGYLAQSARAARDTLALTTLAGIANSYFEWLALMERLAIARSNVHTAEELLGVVKARFDAGAATPVELATQMAARDTAALAAPDLAQRAQEMLSALALLVGRPPEGFELEPEALDAITEPEVAPGLPAELLARRPDVYLAEADLRSADADVVAARAALLPGVTLTAAGGIQNPALNAAVLALPGTGPALSLGGSLAQSIFDRGRLRAQHAEAEARSEELLASYRAAILAALADTEKALAAIRHLDEAEPYQAESLSAAERAFDGAQLRYREGAGDYLTLLDAQRTLYAAREQGIQYRVARLQARVALCKALGGGWRSPDSPATSAPAGLVR
jgi:NodT family efflux transporter outer membrane factor (OMF) lipoprotein